MYPVAQERRPWVLHKEAYEQVMRLAPMWLKDRGGVVVYENHMMDSSHLGETTFMPARFIAQEDDQMHDAPMQHRPNGGVPSCRMEAVDHITLEQYNGDAEKAIAAAFKEEPPEEPRRKSRKRVK